MNTITIDGEIFEIIEIPEHSYDIKDQLIRRVIESDNKYCLLAKIGEEKPIEEEEPVYTIGNLQWTQTIGKMTWINAVEYCDKLNYGGYQDWRLPTINEIFTIIDYNKYEPACKIEECYLAGYWSSTTDANGEIYAWRVNFNLGDINLGNKFNDYYVMAVRR